MVYSKIQSDKYENICYIIFRINNYNFPSKECCCAMQSVSSCSLTI